MESQSGGERTTQKAPAFAIANVATSAGALTTVGQEEAVNSSIPPTTAPVSKKAYKSASAEKAQEWIDVIFPATGRLVQGVVPAGVAGVCGLTLLDPSLFPALSHDQAICFLTAALGYLGLGNLGARK